ncbi:ribonuclease domain-containing protein [Streptomyces sp. BE303]|uniref:ribonuclease domain-containing protein n=1 Tax=Streptomyces sp. BE303 TaxID=3002528 RepID=UPI002E769DEE|nr:ribonuclease domain-containing protein [Streptomyces sp. BE303]
MTSRNRLFTALAVLLCVLAAAVGYVLSDDAGDSTPEASVTSSTGPATPKSTGPRPTAPRSTAPKPSPPAGTASAPGTPAPAGTWVPTDPAMADVCRTGLPVQARDTLGLIAKGGPYPYRSDGIVFENRESRLPRKTSGYYHEFTVVTPGSADRGARRVVTGESGEQFWTADHYATFQEIDVRC